MLQQAVPGAARGALQAAAGCTRRSGNAIAPTNARREGERAAKKNQTNTTLNQSGNSRLTRLLLKLIYRSNTSCSSFSQLPPERPAQPLRCCLQPRLGPSPSHPRPAGASSVHVATLLVHNDDHLLLPRRALFLLARGMLATTSSLLAARPGPRPTPTRP